MELRRWLWIALVLQTLIWALFFVFGFFGFAETLANAPDDWWLAYRFDYWILVGVGFASLPAYHLVAWLAASVDSKACRKSGAKHPVYHRYGGAVWNMSAACWCGVCGSPVWSRCLDISTCRLPGPTTAARY